MEKKQNRMVARTKSVARENKDIVEVEYAEVGSNKSKLKALCGNMV